MKPFDWDPEKNERLKAERDISFEEIVSAIDNGQIIKTIAHPNQGRYPNQKMYIIDIHDYAYLVPFVEEEDKRFLKTIIPSRKATKKYLYRKEA